MKNKYDVTIIGAGIGGLVCGSYLAMAGFKVLLVEQHDRPGGYCTSFQRRGFTFDAGPHYIGSLRNDGVLAKMLKELGVFDRISFARDDPTDTILTPDYRVRIHTKNVATQEELVVNFPRERENIVKFFDFITQDGFLKIAAKTRKLTFQSFLKAFFKDLKLQAILSIPLGSIGLPASKASALVGVILYREFVLDGGYYPKHGMQSLSNAIGLRFKELGGELLLSKKVTRIFTKNNKVQGIEINGGEFVSSKFVVSNADLNQTFSKLLDCKASENRILSKLEPSPSAFVAYLGVNKKVERLMNGDRTGTVWYFNSYDMDKCYLNNSVESLAQGKLPYIFLSFPSLVDNSIAPHGHGIIRMFLGCQYAEKATCDFYRQKIYDRMLMMATKVVPDIRNHLEVEITATPHTFCRYTNNYHGALFGLAATLMQMDRKKSFFKTSIKNFYLTGHWVTNGIGQSGVAMVGYCGKHTADAIIRRVKWNK